MKKTRILDIVYDVFVRFLVVCLLVNLLLPNLAYTQEPLPEAEKTALARSLFHKGIRFLEQKEWEQASDYLGRSFRLRPSSVVAYNLALALEPQLQLLKASELLRGVIRDENAQSQLRSAAKELLDQLTARTGTLSINLQGEMTDVDLTLDEEPILPEVIGVPVPIDPGRHVIVATRNGEQIALDETIIKEGNSGVLTLIIPPPAPEPVPEPVPEQPPPPTPSVQKEELAPKNTVSTPEKAPNINQGFHNLQKEESVDSLFTSGWFWIGAGVVLAGIITVAVVTDPGN